MLVKKLIATSWCHVNCEISGYFDVSMCYARLKVGVLTLKRAEHFQSS